MDYIYNNLRQCSTIEREKQCILIYDAYRNPILSIRFIDKMYVIYDFEKSYNVFESANLDVIISYIKKYICLYLP